MARKTLKERLAENEAVFREHNEKVQKDLAHLKESAKKEGHADLFDEGDTPLHFLCECSDENCTKRVVVKPSRYTEIHRNRNRFIIAPSHAVSAVERVVVKEDGYNIVEKDINAPESPDQLKSTPINND